MSRGLLGIAVESAEDLRIRRALVVRPLRADGAPQDVVQLLLFLAPESAPLPEDLRVAFHFEAAGSEVCEETDRDHPSVPGAVIVEVAPRRSPSLCLSLIHRSADVLRAGAGEAGTLNQLVLRWRGGEMRFLRSPLGVFVQEGQAVGYLPPRGATIVSARCWMRALHRRILLAAMGGRPMLYLRFEGKVSPELLHALEALVVTQRAPAGMDLRVEGVRHRFGRFWLLNLRGATDWDERAAAHFLGRGETETIGDLVLVRLACLGEIREYVRTAALADTGMLEAEEVGGS